MRGRRMILHLIRQWRTCRFLVTMAALSVLPIYSFAQEVGHIIYLRNIADPNSEATTIRNTLVNSNNNLVSLVSSSEKGETQLEELGQNPVIIKKGRMALLETDRDGQLIWYNEIGVQPEDTSLGAYHARFVHRDANDNYYIIINTPNSDIYINDQLVRPKSREDKIVILKFDENGAFLKATRVETTGERLLIQSKFKNDLFYFLSYHRNASTNTSANCIDYTEVLEVVNTEGKLVEQLSFEARQWDINRQNSCGDGSDNGFFIWEMDVDKDQNIYLSGMVHGFFESYLTSDLSLNFNEHYSVLIKLNSELEVEWNNLIEIQIASNNAYYDLSTPLVVEGKGILLRSRNSHTDYKLSGTSTKSINTSQFKRTNNLFYHSLSFFDFDGNLKWVNFLDRHSAEPVIDEYHNIWLPISRMSNAFDALYYYDESLQEKRLVNPKSPGSMHQSGYLKIDTDGQYITHRFLTDLTTTGGATNVKIRLMQDYCNEYYLISALTGNVDLEFEIGSQTKALNKAKNDWFIARYSNEKPRLDINTAPHEQCLATQAFLPMQITDEKADSVKIEAFSNDQSILPNDSISIIYDNGTPTLKISSGYQSGHINIQVRVTDVCGAFTDSSFPWSIKEGPPKPIINNGESEFNLCDQPSYVLTSSADNNLWSTGETTKSITVTESGLYWVRQLDATGCGSVPSDTVDVYLFQSQRKPIITSSTGTNEVCEGEVFTLTTDLDRNIVWSTGETTKTITVSQSGSYSVFENSILCGAGVKSDPFEVIINPIPDKPNIQVSGSLRFCEDESITLTAPNNNGNPIWSTGATTLSIKVSSPGKYWLRMEKNGCISESSDTLDIVVDKDFDFSITTDTTMCVGYEELELSPEINSEDIEFLWSNGSNSPSISITTAGEYWLEASRGACLKKAYINVEKGCYPIIQVPNAFSPNGDQMNDFFEIGLINATSFQMKIFNQWGNTLFETSSTRDQWDGTFRDQRVPPGSYIYRIFYTGEIKNEPIEFVKSGTISVIY